ncbi:AraC family transcriptional regulator [Pseudochelatococcus sp. B33]
MHPPVTVPIAAVTGMLSGVAAQQEDRWLGVLVEEAGIPRSLLAEKDARVTGDQYVKLFTTLMNRLDDECLGLLSRPLRRGGFALVARSAPSAPSLAVALDRIGRGFGLLIDDVTFAVVHDNSLTGLVLCPRPGMPQPRNFFFELLLRVCWRLLAWLRGGRLPASRFDFCFPRPDYADIYGDIFRAPVRFDQPTAAVWLDSAALRGPVRRDANDLEAFLASSPANVVLPWLGERTAGAQVHALLQRTCPVWPDLPAAAKSLNMSVSTLQRRLNAEGKSFQMLKDQLRRDLAIMRLVTSTEPLSVLAAELGFADCAAFQRAFKTWTGSAPGAYRRMLETDVRRETPPALSARVSAGSR